MFYDFAVTVPAGTAKADPKVERLPLDAGIITDVYVDFPAGCRGYVDVVIDHSESQLYPKNNEGSFHGEEYTLWNNIYAYFYWMDKLKNNYHTGGKSF